MMRYRKNMKNKHTQILETKQIVICLKFCDDIKQEM